MHVSLNWLKQYIHLPAEATPKEIALKLTMSTVEVDGVEEQGKNLEGIVVGKIQKVSAHPNADKLKVCQVDIGEKVAQVVCGGSNVKENMLVAVAKIGSYVRWHGEGDLVEMKLTAIRGVDSEGMICASSEIGLAERFPLKEEKEILDLSFLHRVKPGTPVATALSLNDTIIEIDNKSMTNRPDLWGHYGLARELAAIFSKRLHKYEPMEIKASKERKLEVVVEDVKFCPRYMAVEIKDIKIEESPKWLQDKLLAVGLRPINNIVDITNYVMLDLGQPLHAFDAEKLTSEKIIVRRAKDGEDFVSLDGGKHKLENSMLVIADENKPIALAGVMGGLESGITEKANRIIFESANFEPVSVRKAAIKLGLRTDASARFEKSLDPNLCPLALKKAVQMVLEVCNGAAVCSNVVDESHFYLQQGPIETSIDFLNKKIGMDLEKKIIVGILERLGFTVKTQKNNLSVTIPTWRSTKDISIPEDLVEEIARIYGYDNIKTSLPAFPIVPPQVNQLRALEHQVRDILVKGLAFVEVHNYSFVSANQISNLGDDLNKYVSLDNPLSKEKPFLRRNLLLNVLENLSKNIEYESELRLLEIGKTFLAEEPGARAEVKGDELLPRQDTYLTVVFSAKKEEAPFWEIKKAVELLMADLHLTWQARDSIHQNIWEHPGRAADVVVENKVAGQIYELNPLVSEKFGISARVAVADINLTILSEMNQGKVVYRPVPVYPEVERDVAIVVEKKIRHEEIVEALSRSSSLLKKVELFDVYEGEHVPVGHKSMAYHLTFADPQKTLTTDEVDAAQTKAVKELQDRFKAQIRR